MTSNKHSASKLQSIKNGTIATALVIFGISLTQDAIRYDDYDGEKVLSAMEAFAMGSTAILGGGLLEWVIWLANPLSFFGLLLFYRDRKVSAYLCFYALLLGASFLAWDEILAAENGRTAPIISYSVGYYLWLIYLLILFLGSFKYFQERGDIN